MSNASIRVLNRDAYFSHRYVYEDEVCPTITSEKDCLIHFESPQFLSKTEVCKASSFPLDYDFVDQSPHYVCGMSVPPVMMANIAARVYEQWLLKINS